MLRTILAVIGGYVVMVCFVILGIATVWFGMGNSFAFVGETSEASLGWSLLILAAGFIASIAAGIVATLIAGQMNRQNATRGLMGLIVGLGLLTAVMNLMKEPKTLPQGKTIQDLSFVEAGEFAHSPTWYDFAIIGAGVAGVLIGSSFVKQGDTTKA